MATLIPAIGTCVARMTGGRYQSGANAIQVMTMKVSKGLEFPLVALPTPLDHLTKGLHT